MCAFLCNALKVLVKNSGTQRLFLQRQVTFLCKNTKKEMRKVRYFNFCCFGNLPVLHVFRGAIQTNLLQEADNREHKHELISNFHWNEEWLVFRSCRFVDVGRVGVIGYGCMVIWLHGCIFIGL